MRLPSACDSSRYFEGLLECLSFNAAAERPKTLKSETMMMSLSRTMPLGFHFRVGAKSHLVRSLVVGGSEDLGIKVTSAKQLKLWPHSYPSIYQVPHAGMYVCMYACMHVCKYVDK